MSIQKKYMISSWKLASSLIAGLLIVFILLSLVPIAESQYGGCTVNPRVETLDATNVSTTTATINGELISRGDVSAVFVSFVWGIGGEGDCCTKTECEKNSCQPGNCTDCQNATETEAMLSAGTFSFDLSGLEPDTTYYFRAKAKGCDSVCGDCLTFTTEAYAGPGCVSPEVETNAATEIETTAAKLNGTLLNMGSPAMGSVEVSFEWGIDTEYGNETSFQPMLIPGTFSARIQNLEPDTTYHFRARATSCEYYLTGGITSLLVFASATVSDYVYGEDMTFTTAAALEPTPTIIPTVAPGDRIPPTVITGSATNVLTDTVTINGTLESLGTSATILVYFEWGTSDSYGYQTNPQLMSGTGDFHGGLDGLECETTYHFRAVGIGHGTSQGEDVTFTTALCEVTPPGGKIPPTVQTGTPFDVSTDSVTVTGILEDMGEYSIADVFFRWDTRTHDGLHVEDYEYKTDTETMSGTGTFARYIDNLEPVTTYYYRADVVGGKPGEERTFTTKCVDVITVTTESESITSDSAKLGGTLEDMGAEEGVEVYFEWGTTRDYGNETEPQPMNTIGPFEAETSGLDCDTTYHFRAVAKGNKCTDYGEDKEFTTLECPSEGFNPWIAIGPILAAILLALLFFLLFGWRRKYVITVNPESKSITSNSAKLPGKLKHIRRELKNMKKEKYVGVYFEWGKTTDYGKETKPQTMSDTGPFEAGISGLESGTTYHFRAVGKGKHIDYGEDKKFQTL